MSQFWDAKRAAGTYLAELDLGGLGFSGVVWDAYFLFGPKAVWDQAPAPLLASGAPVILDGEQLVEALSAYK